MKERLTIGGVVEVHVGIAKRTTGHAITTDPDRSHRAVGIEDLEEVSLGNITESEKERGSVGVPLDGPRSAGWIPIKKRYTPGEIADIKGGGGIGGGSRGHRGSHVSNFF